MALSGASFPTPLFNLILISRLSRRLRLPDEEAIEKRAPRAPRHSSAL